MVTVIFKATTSPIYRGFDPETGAALTVEAGCTVRVSDAKATQLFHDFPSDWEQVGEAPAPVCKEKAEAERPEPRSKKKDKRK